MLCYLMKTSKMRVAVVILVTQRVVGYKDLAKCIMGHGFPKH